MRRLTSPTLPLILCLAALLACKKGKEDDASPSQQPEAPPASASAPAAATPAGAGVTAVKPGEAKPGPAYFAVKETGVVMLDAGKVTTVVPLRFLVQDMVYGPDGAVWVSSISGVHRIQGSQVKEVNSSGGFESIAVVSEKDAYAVNYQGVHHYDGASWSVEGKEALGATLLRDVEVAPDGAVWVASSNLLHQKAKGSTTWTKVDLTSDLGSQPYFNDLVKGPDGTLYAACNRGLLKLEAGQWKKVAGDFGFMGTDHLDVSLTGSVAATSGTKDLFLVGPGGLKKVDAASAGLPVSMLHELALDGAGRVWLATDHGVAVLDPDGKKLVHWAPSTLEGITGEVSHIVVVGTGPAVLPPAGTPATGTVKGKVIKGGAPVANAEIELCTSPSMLFTGTPCADKPFKQVTKADAQGEFRLPDVPIGSYGFAIRPTGGKWLITLGGDCCSKMQKGQEYDIGALTLKD